MKFRTYLILTLLSVSLIIFLLIGLAIFLIIPNGFTRVLEVDALVIVFSILGVLSAIFASFYISLRVLLTPISSFAESIRSFNMQKLTFHLPRGWDKYPEEIQVLGNTFRNVVNKLKKSLEEHDLLHKELNKKISRKTKELDDQLKEEENMRLATMNILEDIDEARKRLKEEDIRKNELFNITSHELKTPLVPIKGYTGLLVDEKYGKLSNEQKNALNIVSRNAQRLESLIGDVLDIARLQAGKMKLVIDSVNLTVLVKDAVDGMQSMAKKRGVYLKTKFGKVPLVLGDRNRIFQVITNFIKNAIKFTEKGGVTVSVYATKGSVFVDVKDTGIGILPKDQNKVFERFYQVDSSITRRFGGTGLGLPISKGIAENHGGRVHLHSAIGKGSTFTIELPAKSPLKKGASYGLGIKMGVLPTPDTKVRVGLANALPRKKKKTIALRKSAAEKIGHEFRRS